MPVTIRADSIAPRGWSNFIENATSPGTLLQYACKDENERCKTIFQSSFNDISSSNVSPSKNGLVYAAHYAYSNHHHLTIRPEDIWFAILTQLNFYINAHAEELRSLFVAHEGQSEVEVVAMGTIHTVDFGDLAVQMTGEMDKQLVDQTLKPWILPDFTTTGDSDTVTAAVLMMGSMQAYFSYTMTLRCGIPSVTLLGEREDYVKIRNRLDKIEEFGEEPKKFAARLRTVLDNLVKSFDNPKDESVQDFFGKIAHWKRGGSGPSWLSGWITAFCSWKPNGDPVKRSGRGSDTEIRHIDGTEFLPVETNDIPAGYASVPVKVDDNGRIYKTRMVAGSVGIEVTSSGEKLDQEGTNNNEKTGLDSLQPVTGWWMYQLKDEE